MRTPAEQAERLAGELQVLAGRLREGEGEDAPMFTRTDVDRFIEERLARERKKRRRVEEERDELADELEELRPGREEAV